MRTRSILALAVPLLLLSACASSAPDDAPEPTASYTPSQEQLDAEANSLEVPPGALMAVDATVTASNGAVLDVLMVIRESLASTDPAATVGVAATESWCAGEMDGAILADQGYSLTAVDVTATLVSGEWPAGTSLHLYPEPRPNVVLTATGDLRQTPTGSEGDFTPHCVTPVALDGPGAGTILLGIAGDVDGDGDGTPPLGGWTHNTYGFNATSPDGTVADVTISDCRVTISDLGSSYGAGSGSDWTSPPGVGACAAGGGMG